MDLSFTGLRNIVMYGIPFTVLHYIVEELPHNMSSISSATENTTMEVPQKILILSFSVTTAYHGISIIII